MKTQNDLIKQLIQDHSKVRRDLPPLMRLIIFFYFLPIIFTIIFYLFNSFNFTIKNFSHGVELISLFLFLNILTYFGFQSFIPGENKSKSFKFVLLSFIPLSYAFVHFLLEPHSYNLIRQNCEFEAMAISLVSTISLHFLLRRNEFALNNSLSKICFFSVPMTATVLMHGVCSLEIFHVLSCHVFAPISLPVLYFIIKYFYQRK